MWWWACSAVGLPQACSQAQRPEFVEAAVQDAEGRVVVAGDHDELMSRANPRVAPDTNSRCLARRGVAM